MATHGYLLSCRTHGPAARLTVREWNLMLSANSLPRCVRCRREVAYEAIEGRFGAGRCDARCWDAIRGKCACECGGAEHARTFGVFERAS